MSNGTTDYLYELLASIQLEAFATPLREKLQITRLTHFDYVKQKDLEKIGMSKPAIRRLLDAVARTRKMQVPVRPPPPVPVKGTVSKPVTSIAKILNNQALPKKALPKGSQQQAELASTSTTDVSQIISADAIQFVKTQSREDEILGRGHFGVVKKAIWTKSAANKLTVAVKCLNSASSSDDIEGGNNGGISEIVNEISAMCQLNHPNLIKLYGIVFNPSVNKNSLSTDMVWLITELAPHGSLYSYLRKFKVDKKYPPLNRIYSFIYQIACGMEYLESKKLIHRDLAARNILLSTPEHVKICDFGMTRAASKNGQYKMTESHKIPCAWYAPESIRHKLFSPKSDVWAFGVTVWECFALGEQPWPHLSAGEILGKLELERKRLSQPYLCSRSFYRVILSCWEFEPGDRPTFASLKEIIKGTRIVDMRAKDDFQDDGRLQVTRGDLLTIVDGCAQNYWWKGQNKRTLDVGKFPRMILDPERKLCGEDISLPLRNSFIHTGHMGAESNSRSWGNPGKIDEIFLRNPQKPPDLDEEEEETTVINYKSQQHSSQPNQDVLLIDFSDSISSNDLKVSYPDSNKSESASLADLASLEVVPAQQPYYANTQYMYDRSTMQIQPSLPPRPLPSPQPQQPSTYYNDIAYVSIPKQSTEANNSTNLKPTNPFYLNSQTLPSTTSSSYQSQVLELSHNNPARPPSFTSTCQGKSNLDDLLSKVMNDVLNDFDNLKY